MPDLKIALVIPSTGSPRIGYAISLLALGSYFASKRMLPECDVQEISPFVEESSCISANRHHSVVKALAWGASHILMLDEDLFFDPRIIEIMLGRRQKVVGLNYVMRGARSFTALALDKKTRVSSSADKHGLEPCWYLPQGGTLIESSVYQSIEPPWFLQDWVPASKEYMTEDAYFFDKVRAAGFVPYVDHDASHLVQHVGTKHWSFEEVTQDGG